MVYSTILYYNILSYAVLYYHFEIILYYDMLLYILY